MTFCGSCGTRASAEGQAFCQACGQPLVASAPAATAPPATAPVPFTPPVDHLSEGPVTLPPHTPGWRPSGRLVGGAVAAALALTIGGVAAVQVLGGGGGGADSPEQAVSELVAAINAQDPVAAVDLLNPEETRGLGEVVSTLRERLASEDLTTTSGRLTEAGTLSIADLDLSTSNVGEGIAKVRVEGSAVTAAYDPSALPDAVVPASGAGSADSWKGDAASKYEESMGFPISLTTVEVDGRWYVSPLASAFDLQVDRFRYWGNDDYTIASPDYDAYAEADTAEPIVGDTVREAVANTVDAATSDDLDELLATLPAGQAAVMRPYLPVLQSILRNESASFTVSLDGIEGEESDEGDLRRLVIARASVTASGATAYDGGTTTAYVEGDCVGYDSDYDGASACLDGGLQEWTGIDEPSLLARKVDGGWQLDPFATAVDYLSQAVEGADVARLTRAVREEW